MRPEAKLNKLCLGAAEFAGHDSGRDLLKNIIIMKDKMIATDGRIMITVKLEEPVNTKEELFACVKADVFRNILKMFPKPSKEQQVPIVFVDRESKEIVTISTRIGTEAIEIMTPNEKYIPLEAIENAQPKGEQLYEFCVNPAFLQKICQFAKKQKFSNIRFTIHGPCERFKKQAGAPITVTMGKEDEVKILLMPLLMAGQ